MKQTNNSGATLGFENKLWEMADKMRGHMDAGEYKHVVPGLIFLKYISDAFQARHDVLSATAEIDFTDPEDRDEYAAAEGKSGGEFYTPQCIVQLLVQMIEPFKGRVFDPCCGLGGMFVQSERFVEEHGGRIGDIAVYGQESNPTTWKLAKMNLAIRGIDANLGQHHADSFISDLHNDLKADFILANPPFYMSDWGGPRLKEDVRWKNYGTPPDNNANYVWIQYFIHHLSPNGIAGFVLANGPCLAARPVYATWRLPVTRLVSSILKRLLSPSRSKPPSITFLTNCSGVIPTSVFLENATEAET